jgi:hypothetical protein
LRTEDCFEEQKIFEETAGKNEFFKLDHHQDPSRAHIKFKLLNKMLEGVTIKKEVPTYDASKFKEQLPSRAKSIKIVKFRDSKERKK